MRRFFVVCSIFFCVCALGVGFIPLQDALASELSKNEQGRPVGKTFSQVAVQEGATDQVVAAQSDKAASANSDGLGDGVICYYESEGYIISMPLGWVNLTDEVPDLPTCGLYGREGFNLMNAPALIYARSLPLPEGSDPVGTFAKSSLAQVKERPDSVDSVISRRDKLVSEQNLEFELIYLDWKPDTSTAEILACHAGKESMLLVVLSAIDAEQRREAEDLFKMVLKAVLPMQVQYDADK